MREVGIILGGYYLLILALVVLSGLGGLFYYNVIYPNQVAAQRNVDVQSRQNVVGVQTAMRQDMQDYVRQSSCPACQQQDIYDMQRLRDQLPNPATDVPPDIQAFLSQHGA